MSKKNWSEYSVDRMNGVIIRHKDVDKEDSISRTGEWIVKEYGMTVQEFVALVKEESEREAAEAILGDMQHNFFSWSSDKDTYRRVFDTGMEELKKKYLSNDQDKLTDTKK